MGSIFYYDNALQEYERQHMSNNIIYYLEDKYKQNHDEKLFSTYIAYLWYFFVEGDVNVDFVDYNWEFFYLRIKKAMVFGLENLTCSDRLCFVMGYILSLHWMNIDANLENKGDELLKKALNMSTDTSLRDLTSYIIQQRKTILNVDDVRRLFPNESLLDIYFREVCKC